MPTDPRIVLSADDDEDAHFLLAKAFLKSKTNAELKHVYDGTQALAYLDGEGEFSDRSKFPFPNVLLLDLKMPNLSGLDVLEKLGHSKDKRLFSVIVMTSSENTTDREDAEKLGCDGFLVKPTAFKVLVEMVKLIVESPQSSHGGKPEESDGAASAHELRQTPPSVAKEEKPPEPLEEIYNCLSHNSKGEEERVESPEVFKLLVEQIQDYAIFLLSPKGIVRSWNQGARRIKGYEASEIIGEHFSIFYPQSDIEAKKPENELRIAQEMGKYEEEGWRLRKDGSRLWASVVLTALRDDKGNVCGFAKVTRDLTQKKLQEDQLRQLVESEERFRLLVEQVKDYAIFFLDTRGYVSSWNQGARRIKGYEADEIIGKHFSTFYTEADLATEKPARELAIAIREGRYEEEGWRIKKDRSQFWANVVITALWDSRGNLTGFAKVSRDLTKKKKADESLRARTTELEAFAHTLSHDLRAPIRTIASFAELLEEDDGTLAEADRKMHLRRIKKAAVSVNSLIHDILKLSEASLTKTESVRFNVEEVIRDAVQLQEGEILERKAVINIQKAMPWVSLNRTALLQIFSNLIGNALKFSRPGEIPKVEIFSVQVDGGCEIHVKDSGIGIARENQHVIFNAFYRANRNPVQSGNGIGLSIVKRCVERIGGRISVSSAIGEGSNFIVRLPGENPERAQATAVAK